LSRNDILATSNQVAFDHDSHQPSFAADKLLTDGVDDFRLPLGVFTAIGVTAID
jgi:hypothetical protein